MKMVGLLLAQKKCLTYQFGSERDRLDLEIDLLAPLINGMRNETKKNIFVGLWERRGGCCGCHSSAWNSHPFFINWNERKEFHRGLNGDDIYGWAESRGVKFRGEKKKRYGRELSINAQWKWLDAAAVVARRRCEPQTVPPLFFWVMKMNLFLIIFKSGNKRKRKDPFLPFREDSFTALAV